MNRARLCFVVVLVVTALAACKPRRDGSSELATAAAPVCTPEAMADLRAVLTEGALGSTQILVDIDQTIVKSDPSSLEVVPPPSSRAETPDDFEGGVPGNVATMTPIKRESEPEELAQAARQPDAVKYLRLSRDSKSGKPVAKATVRSLQFLACLPNLTGFDLERIPLPDFSDLRVAKKLTSLSIEESGLEDLRFLKALRLLRSLHLPSNRITDVQSLMYLPLLDHLDLSHNKGVKNIMAVKDIPGLEYLWISDCSIKDLSPLSGHDYLEQIDAQRNELTSLKGIDKLPKLRDLFVSSNRITSLDDLSALPSLDQLGIGRNCIKAVNQLERFPALRWLGLSENPIRDLPSGLNSATLDDLDLTALPAKSWDPMRSWDMPKLRRLEADLSLVDDMSPVNQFPSLAVLVARGGAFRQLPKLWSLPDLGTLNLSGAKFSRLDLGNLAGPGIKQWISVDLSKSKVEEVVLPDQPTARQITLMTDDEAHTTRIRRMIPNDRRIWAETSDRHNLDVAHTTGEAVPVASDPREVPYLSGQCPD